MVAHMNMRDEVLQCLSRAGVPQKIANGIMDILADAGFKPLEKLAAVLVLHNAVVPGKADKRIKSEGLPKIEDALPPLLLTLEMRLSQPAAGRARRSIGYAKMAAANQNHEHASLQPAYRLTDSERVA